MPGPAIIVIGNGPSLRGVALENLRGVPTIGMNAAYRHWDTIGWSPTYYACADHRLALSHVDFFVESARAGRFRGMMLPASVLDRAPELAAHAGVVFLDQYLPYFHKAYGAAAGLARCESAFFDSLRPSLVTTGAVALRWALTMGYRRIGMIGIDCRYQPLDAWAATPEPAREANPGADIALTIDRPVGANPNYFFDDYQRAGDLFNVPEPDAHGGHLHRDAIAAVRDDVIALGSDAELSVLGTGSLLHEEGVVAYRPLPRFLREVGLTAVLLDATGVDALAAATAIANWDDPARWPGARLAAGATRVLAVLVDADADATPIERAFGDAFLLPHSFSVLRIVRGGDTAAALVVLADDVRAGEALVMRVEVRPLRPNWLEEIAGAPGADGASPRLIPLSGKQASAGARVVRQVAMAKVGETGGDVRRREPAASLVTGAGPDWCDRDAEPEAIRLYGDGLRLIETRPMRAADAWSAGADDGRGIIFRIAATGEMVAGDRLEIDLHFATAGMPIMLLLRDAEGALAADRTIVTPRSCGVGTASIVTRSPATVFVLRSRRCRDRLCHRPCAAIVLHRPRDPVEPCLAQAERHVAVDADRRARRVRRHRAAGREAAGRVRDDGDGL